MYRTKLDQANYRAGYRDGLKEGKSRTIDYIKISIKKIISSTSPKNEVISVHKQINEMLDKFDF